MDELTPHQKVIKERNIRARDKIKTMNPKFIANNSNEKIIEILGGGKRTNADAVVMLKMMEVIT